MLLLTSKEDYSLSDLNKAIRMINKSEEGTAESKKKQIDAVREVYQFCQNNSECRRVQVLQYFDEKFNKETCNRGCDVCEDSRETILEDVTDSAKAAIQVVQLLVRERGEKLPLGQLKAILRGSKSQEVRNKQYESLPYHGVCAKMHLDLVELMLNRLILREVFINVPHKNGSGFHCDYLDVCSCGLFTKYTLMQPFVSQLGPNSQAILDNQEAIVLNWHPKPLRRNATGGNSVSAPARPRKGKQKVAIDDDPIEECDDMYDGDDPVDHVPPSRKFTSVVQRPKSAIASTSSSKKPTPALSCPPSDADGAQLLYQNMLNLRSQV